MDDEASCLKVDQVPGGCSCKSSLVYCAAVDLHCSHNEGLMKMLFIHGYCICGYVFLCGRGLEAIGSFIYYMSMKDTNHLISGDI